MGRLPGLWMMFFFSLFFSAPPTHIALLAFSFIVPNLSRRPDEDKGDEEGEEEEEDEDEEEEGGLAMDSMPWMASRVLGEAGASSLQITKRKRKNKNNDVC